MSDLALNPILPQWWNDHLSESWQRQREAALQDWERSRDRTIPMDPAVAEHALAFGHGARSAFSTCTTWDAVSVHLRADWNRLGNTGVAAWDKVAELVRHEWQRAAGPGGDASPESPVAPC